MSDVIAALSLDQVSRLTGLSANQLIDWDSTGFYPPSYAYEKRRSPYSRIYSFEDLVSLRTLSVLRERVSMQHLREAAEKLKQHTGRPWSELTLYVLNREVHFKRPLDGQIEGAVTGQYGATIPLESVAEEMRERSEALKVRDPTSVGKLDRHRHVMGNEVVISGTRILVASVRALADAGYSPQEILAEYPDLQLPDVQAALHFDGKLTRAA